MPGYGISDDPTGLLPWSWAEQRLRDARSYWLATASAAGVPHLAAVWAVWHEGALWFSTAPRARKTADLTAQPRCSLAPEHAAESVVLTGVARLATGAAEIEELQRVYAAKYGSGVPEPDINPVYAVAPQTVIAVIDREPDFTTRATRWRFPADQR